MGDSGLSAEGLQSFRAALVTLQEKGDEWWARAEGRAAQLIAAIQPNAASYSQREAIRNYVESLIKSSCANLDVVRFGSVPLKTYLPDGDIDLTVVSLIPEAKRTWFEDVRNALQKEIGNPNAEFRVTEVQGVPDAEIKLLKIYVAKLLVDVSFDQLGGVCTLCFLEEVDRLIGDDHLFKRSIILVKAWCYYESRLLDAANNLMSTYALETLVLYIFHIFHASIRGPLQVLYLFLEFFSGFDWDKYCVSLASPILLDSFKEDRFEDFQKLALSPRRDGEELLFTKAFLDACERAYGGMIPVNQRSKPSKFAVKSLNIIDPLRSTNNLGRSVNQGNCARIRRAFVHGARTMRRILHASEADISAELNQFFKNCTSRSNQRVDVAVAVPRLPKPTNDGGAKRDVVKADSRNGNGSVPNGHHVKQSSPNHCSDPIVSETVSREALDSSLEYGGGSSLWSTELASAGDVNASQSAAKLKTVEVALNSDDCLSQICSPSGIDELCPGMFNERNGSGHKARGKLERRDFLVANLDASKQGIMASGSCTNGSTSPSRADSEEEEDCSSQSSSKGETIASEASPLGEEGSLPLGKEGLLPLPCGPENFESTRNDLLQESPADQHSSSDFSFSTEAQTQLYGKQKAIVGNDELSAPPEVYKQTGNGCEYSEASSSKLRSGRKAKQNGSQSKDPDGKSKRGSGKAKGVWSFDDGKEKASHGRDVGQVSSSQQSPLPFQHVHPHFKNSQSRPYLNATGPGSFRHPLVNYQFDPGTARMNGSSPPPQYLLSFYPAYPPMGMFPPGFPHPMYSPGMNIHKRNSPAKGDAKNRTGPDANGSLEAAAENSGESPSIKSQPKPSEQIMVGIVEKLEAEGVIASTSSKRVAARNTYGTDNTSEFLTGDLKLHLQSLRYGPMCEYSCSPSLNQIIYPTYYGAEQKHSSWEGPGRPDTAMRAQLLAPQFFASGPAGWLQPFQPQSGYFPYFQPFWGTRGVELSPRPRGTGTYLPNTLRQNNNRPSGRSQNRSQNGSAQQQEDRNLHETNGQHFHGPHNRVIENRAGKTERVHHPPKHQDFARASLPCEPPVASPVEVLQPSELVLESVPLDVRDTSGQNAIAVVSEEEPGMADEFSSPGDDLLDQGGKRNSPHLTRSASVGHSHDSVKPEESASLPITIEVIPTATTQRVVLPTYHMKEEDFPPLGGRRVRRAESIGGGGTGTFANVIASDLGSYVSL